MIPRTLTIAGSDPGGGAGIQADLKTFTALRVFGMAAITALTVQNTRGVRAVNPVPPIIVSAQIDAVLEDIGATAVKIGMLSSAAIIKAAAERLRGHRAKNIVLDPVMYAKSGHALLDLRAEGALVTELFALSLLVTPNAPEASRLTGINVRDANSARKAAKAIRSLGPRFVLIKGGHLKGPFCSDLLFDGDSFREFRSRRINTRNTHGTGCTLSAAIAAYLARGENLPEAVRKALGYVNGAIKNSFSLGKGQGPLNHFWRRLC